MGMPVMIMGDSGSGKTASLRNFKTGEIFIFEVAGKELPFPTDKEFDKYVAQRVGYDRIKKVILNAVEKSDIRRFVVDDSQYLMAFESFDHANETGFTKNINMAKHFKDLIDFVITQTPRNCIVYFLHHTERGDDGRVKVKTLGKMLDNQLVVEGLFTTVLMTQVSQRDYKFVTHNVDGMTTIKTPMGMFKDDTIGNDLKIVDEKIRAYYNWEVK